MTESSLLRQKAYLRLLSLGLFRVRDHAAMGEMELCQIEANHLHNIPSLVYDDNERRHEYYILGERRYYLERLSEADATEELERSRIYYHESWQTLAEIAGVEIE